MFFENRTKAFFPDCEVKAYRRVRDSRYWGLPVGTPILPGMSPRKTSRQNWEIAKMHMEAGNITQSPSGQWNISNANLAKQAAKLGKQDLPGTKLSRSFLFSKLALKIPSPQLSVNLKPNENYVPAVPKVKAPKVTAPVGAPKLKDDVRSIPGPREASAPKPRRERKPSGPTHSFTRHPRGQEPWQKFNNPPVMDGKWEGISADRRVEDEVPDWSVGDVKTAIDWAKNGTPHPITGRRGTRKNDLVILETAGEEKAYHDWLLDQGFEKEAKAFSNIVAKQDGQRTMGFVAGVGNMQQLIDIHEADPNGKIRPIAYFQEGRNTTEMAKRGEAQPSGYRSIPMGDYAKKNASKKARKSIYQTVAHAELLERAKRDRNNPESAATEFIARTGMRVGSDDLSAEDAASGDFSLGATQIQLQHVAYADTKTGRTGIYFRPAKSKGKWAFIEFTDPEVATLVDMYRKKTAGKGDETPLFLGEGAYAAVSNKIKELSGDQLTPKNLRTVVANNLAKKNLMKWLENNDPKSLKSKAEIRRVVLSITAESSQVLGHRNNGEKAIPDPRIENPSKMAARPANDPEALADYLPFLNTTTTISSYISPETWLPLELDDWSKFPNKTIADVIQSEYLKEK